MTDVSRFDDEDDVLGDVGGVIANAFEVARDENEVDAGFDGPRIAKHVGEKLSKDLILQSVEPMHPGSTQSERGGRLSRRTHQASVSDS